MVHLANMYQAMEQHKEDYELREEIYKRHLECYGQNHPETHDAKFALRMAKIFLSEYGGI